MKLQEDILSFTAGEPLSRDNLNDLRNKLKDNMRFLVQWPLVFQFQSGASGLGDCIDTPCDTANFDTFYSGVDTGLGKYLLKWTNISHEGLPDDSDYYDLMGRTLYLKFLSPIDLSGTYKFKNGGVALIGADITISGLFIVENGTLDLLDSTLTLKEGVRVPGSKVIGEGTKINIDFNGVSGRAFVFSVDSCCLHFGGEIWFNSLEVDGVDMDTGTDGNGNFLSTFHESATSVFINTLTFKNTASSGTDQAYYVDDKFPYDAFFTNNICPLAIGANPQILFRVVTLQRKLADDTIENLDPTKLIFCGG